MIKVDIRGLKDAVRFIDQTGKQAQFATSVAITRTAGHVKSALRDEFSAKFDRPTPMVMRSIFIKPARKDDLEAVVWLKTGALGGKNQRSMSQIIGHHFYGGGRENKQIEVVLRQQGFLFPGEMIVPGAGAKLDRYGNMSRGQSTQILSQIGIRGAGYDSTPTGSRRSRRNVARAGKIFWSYGSGVTKKPLVDKKTGIAYGYVGGNPNHLPKGAWVRSGRTVRPLMIAIRSASYGRRFDLNKIGNDAINRHFSIEFNKAFDSALNTARK